MPEPIYQLQAEICRALANPYRLKILDLVAAGVNTSSQLLERLGVPKANLSQHLAVLKAAGILSETRKGPYRVLSLAIPQVEEACDTIRRVLAQRLKGEARLTAELRRGLKKATRRVG